MASKTIRIKVPIIRISSTGAVRKVGTTTKTVRVRVR